MMGSNYLRLKLAILSKKELIQWKLIFQKNLAQLCGLGFKRNKKIYKTQSIIYLHPSYGLGVDVDWWDGSITYPNKPFSMFTSERYYDNNAGYVDDGVYYYSLESKVI